METQGKKKILYLITQSNFGGAQKYVFDLATNLDKHQYEVAVAAGGDGELFTRLETAGIKIIRLKWMKREVINPLADIIGLWEIYKLIKKERPDVVHLNSSKVGFSGSIAGKLAGVKIIYTVHGAVFAAAFSWLIKKLFLLLEKFSARFKDKIICVSEADRQLSLKYRITSPEKLVTIHNGIKITDFLSRAEAKKWLSENCALDLNQLDSSQIVGWNGWFYPEKDLATLIRAAKLIFELSARQNKKILFLIFGSGPDEIKLKLMVKHLKLDKTVVFAGPVAQGAKYLNAFDLFALPSIKEGLPYTILEAMAAGLPIVASRVGGILELIEDGKNGFLVAPRDHEALAEKILQVLENPELAQKFSLASLEKIKEFSLDKMIRQTELLY